MIEDNPNPAGGIVVFVYFTFIVASSLCIMLLHKRISVSLTIVLFAMSKMAVSC